MSYSIYDLNTRISNIQSTVGTISSKTASLQIPPSSNELVVVDTITVADTYPLPFNTTTITPTQIVVDDLASNRSTVSNSQIDITAGGTNDVTLRPVDLVFNDSTGATASYRLDGASMSDIAGYSGDFAPNEIRFTSSFSTNTTFLGASSLTLTDGVTTNKLDINNWTGNINSVNTVANLTHYLGFFNSSGSGNGKPQKTNGLTCNPSTNTITATTFSGNATSSSTATGVNLTSDNTAGTYFLPFSKTVTATGNSLFVDNTTTPLTYNPSTSTVTATNFSGLASSASNVLLTSDNTNGNYYIPFSKLSAGTNPLFVDDVTSPFTYNPSSGLISSLFFNGDIILPTTQNTATFAGTTLSFSGASNSSGVSFRNASVVITGGSNTLSALTITNTVVNGSYKIGILNNGSGNFTINTGLGANIRTVYSGGFNISSGRYGWLTIDVVVINAVTTYVVNAFQLTN